MAMDMDDLQFKADTKKYTVALTYTVTLTKEIEAENKEQADEIAQQVVKAFLDNMDAEGVDPADAAPDILAAHEWDRDVYSEGTSVEENEE